MVRATMCPYRPQRVRAAPVLPICRRIFPRQGGAAPSSSVKRKKKNPSFGCLVNFGRLSGHISGFILRAVAWMPRFPRNCPFRLPEQGSQRQSRRVNAAPGAIVAGLRRSKRGFCLLPSNTSSMAPIVRRMDPKRGARAVGVDRAMTVLLCSVSTLSTSTLTTCASSPAP